MRHETNPNEPTAEGEKPSWRFKNAVSALRAPARRRETNPMATWAILPPARLVPLLAALIALLPGATRAAAPADTFNLPGQHRTRTCAEMKSDVVPLRFPDGTPTGFFAHGDDPSQQGGHQPCPVGSMELDAHEVLTAANGTKLYFHPGGGPGHYRDYVEDGQYGHVAVGDLKSPPKLSPLNLNGKPCPLAAPHEVYFITPPRIPRDMFYKPNVERGRSGSTYYTYGNPGYDKTAGRGDWTYINWSWVQNGKADYPQNICRGGGMVRALGKRDGPFEAGDVAPVIGYSYGPDNRVNGRVTAVYGKTTAGEGGSDIYGWMPHSYQKIGDILVPCVRRAPGEPVIGSTNAAVHDRMERMALNLLSELPSDPRRRDDLLRSITTSRDRDARLEMLTELSRYDEPPTVEAMLELLADERDPRVREQAIVLVGFMRSTPQEMAQVAKTFADAYQRSDDPRERQRLLEIASNIPSPQSVAFLGRLVESPARSQDDLYAAIEGLLRLVPRAAVSPQLLETAARHLESDARAAHDDQARLRALHLLAAPAWDNRRLLEALLKTEKSAELREFLRKVLAQPRAGGAG
jgi:hypothetical protein